MTDFFQNGVVTTLHNLTERSVEELERELMIYRQRCPMGLVIPCLYSELGTPALASIVDTLCQVEYLEEIIIGLDRADEDQFRHAREYFSRLPQQHRILWHDGPVMKSLARTLGEQHLAPEEPGKGRNVWYCIGYLLAAGRSRIMAVHDADIITYDRGLLARLLYPTAQPHFSYTFCKGYYARFSENRLNGRVCRLLVTPLLRALRRIFDPVPYLEYLDSFRYPLSGEFSIKTYALQDLRIPCDWGLEIGILSEVYRNYSTKRLCQVEISHRYDHKHQELSEQDFERGLARMSNDICKAVFRKLATLGYVFSPGTFRTIKATYYRIALDFIRSYYHDARMNGLRLDRHEEEKAVEVFAESIMRAGDTFLENPMETPFIPSWDRVSSALPEFYEELYSLVEEDND
ncbi:MAG: glycosyl transferase [Gammaproteobacteria bacterium]|nr:MAG: glycosyl transferase [Gammaproteobacteria bacterium]